VAIKSQLIENVFGLAILGMVALAFFLPAIAQNPDYHAFADRQIILGIPNGMDTITNLAFVVFGLWGLWQMYTRKHIQGLRALNAGVFVFSFGFVLIGIASAIYHWSPSDETLAIDRFAMSISFAGVIGMLAADRLSERAGVLALVALLCLGPSAVAVWATTGNLTPYAVLQFGGIVLVLVVALLTPATKNGPNFLLLLLIYGLAKIAEAFDHSIYSATSELISGHSLKHLIASFGMLAVLGRPVLARL
jgi:hypothetical protein